MSVIFLLIIFSLLLAVGFLIAFFWSVRSGQFEDDYTPSVRMLFDDEKINFEKADNNCSTADATTSNPKLQTSNH